MSVCETCGKKLNFLTKFRKDGAVYCGDCIDKIKSQDVKQKPNQTQLPLAGQPLICAFQRRFSNPYRVQCALTAIGGGGVISRAFANYGPCLIDICPNYQNWKKDKR